MRRKKRTQWKPKMLRLRRFLGFWSKNGFFSFFLPQRVWLQATLKNFLELQKWCSKYLGASTTLGLSNAHQILVIGWVGKKERNESKIYWNVQILSDFVDFLLPRALKVSLQAAVKNFLELQKWCSKYLGASTTSGDCIARWFKFIGCVDQKERNENWKLVKIW